MADPHIVQAIRKAILDSDVTRVAALLEEEPSRLAMTTAFGTWLHVAAKHGKLEIVKILLTMGADINVCGGILGGGPLRLAASQGHFDVVSYLVEQGATLDVSRPERNPLFGAIYGGHFKVAKLLIERGIDTRVRYTSETMKDMDALAFAREWGRSDIANLLTPRDECSP